MKYRCVAAGWVFGGLATDGTTGAVHKVADKFPAEETPRDVVNCSAAACTENSLSPSPPSTVPQFQVFLSGTGSACCDNADESLLVQSTCSHADAVKDTLCVCVTYCLGSLTS